MRIGNGSWRSLVLRAVLPVALVSVAGCGDGTGPGSDGPTILLMNPGGVPTGTSEFVLELYGRNFTPTSVVHWNNEPRPTFRAGDQVLRASIRGSDVAVSGTARVTVVADGEPSPSATFRIGQALGPGLALTALSPDHLEAGSGPVEIVASGSGFIEGTALFAEFGALTTTVVSGSSLRATVPAELLTVNRTLDIRVGIPAFWTSDQALPLEVRAVTPEATALTPAATAAGSDDLEVRVTGAHFAGNSVVLLDGIERPTTFVSGTELTAVVPASELASAGTIAVGVRTPPPGGGMSATLDLTVTTEAPVLAELPLQGVTADRPGFTLVVHGEHFTAGTVVEWNGVERSTTWRSGRRLFAAIPAGDIAAPGTADIRVRTPGFPATAARQITVHPAPANSVTSIETLDLPINWLTTDPVSGRLFASVGAGGGVHGNTVAELDPLGPSVVTSTFVGSTPTVMDVSDDGQFLYVGLDGAQSVRRVSLPGLVAGPQFSLGTFTVEELHVMPGAPHTVAVSRRNAGFSPSNEGLYVYDDGVARGLGGPGHTGSNTFGWTGDGASMYGYNFETSEFGLRRLSVGPDGVREVWVQSGLIDAYYARIQVAGDRVYAGEGAVVDGDLRERLGTCGMFGWFTVDRALGRAFYWDGATVRVCDLATYQSLGQFDVPVVNAPHPAHRRNIVRWGPDGLAFADETTLHIVRTPLAGP